MPEFTIELTRKIVETVEAATFEEACKKLDGENSDQEESWITAENTHLLIGVE
jgi:hypothetical protein